MITRHIKVPKAKADEIQKWLDSNESIPDAGKTEVVEKWTVNFDGIYEADIKLVNTVSGLYLDCILFDEGSEVGLLDPQYVFLGVYPIEKNNETYTVVIELDTAPCRCPMCGKQGEKDAGYPTCPGFSYE